MDRSPEPPQAPPDRPGIVGRHRELELLTRAGREGGRTCRLAVVSGEAWIGKSALLDAAAGRAATRGGVVLRGRPWGGGTPLGPFADALHDHLAGDPAAGLLEHPLRDPRVLFPAVRALLERLAAGRGLVLLLDDVHLADPLSLDLIDHLLHRPPAAEVLIAAAYRPARIGARLSRLLRDVPGRCVRVDLGPLDPADQEALLPAGLGGAERRLFTEAAAGNPGVLLALLAGRAPGLTADRLRAGTPPVLPAEYAGELAALDPDVRLVAESAAVCGDPFPRGLLPAVAELEEGGAAAALDRLLAADVVRRLPAGDRYAFRDPAVRALAYHSAADSWRRGAHRRAAAALAETGADEVTRAWHVEHLAEPGDAASARVLTAAAQTVLMEAPASSERWLRAARRICAGGTGSAVLLGKALAVRGRLEEGRRLLCAILDEPAEPAGAHSGGSRTEAVAWYARASRLLGRYDQAEAAARDALRRPGDGTDPLMLELGAIALSVGVVDAGLERRMRAVGGSEDPLVRSQALAQRAVAAAGLRRRREAVEPVRVAGYLLDRSGGDLTAELEALYWLAEAERLLGLNDAAGGHYARALESAERHAHGYLSAFLATGLGRVRLRTGDLAGAGRCADRAEEAADAVASDPMRVAALALRSQVRVFAGEPGTALESAGLAVALAGSANDNWARYAQRCLDQARSARGRSTGPRLTAMGPGRPRPVPVAAPVPGPAGPPVPNGVLNTLSRREMEIAELVSVGRTNQQIANALSLSPKTVETYLARIFKKLAIGSRTQIAHLVGLTGEPLTQSVG